jgi:16S rRNA (cytosine967-C5)-methyltransferase
LLNAGRLSAARLAAFDALLAVERGAHSDEALIARCAELDARDAGLAQEIVLGVLRRQLQLDFLIAHFGAPAKLDLPVRLAMRIGVYQLRHLDRVPRHAAVSESVELVKRAGKRSATGMVNAVLRKVTRDEIAWPDRATELSCPGWLLDRWGARAETIARHALTVPPSGMDPGAQSIVPLLALEPEMSFLDLCAAPGNKTRQAMLAAPAITVACDRSFRRLSTVPGYRVLLDAASPLPFRSKFNRVLVDAPCSGTGTLARNPEIKWRLTPDDLPRQAVRQRCILEQALTVGHRIVYSTCSLEPEENEEVVRGLPVVETMRRWPGEDEGDGFFAAVIVP